MRLQQFLIPVFTLFTVLVLTSCSGGGDSGGDTKKPPVTSSSIKGILLDTVIQGVTYTCDGEEHLTDTEGGFECQSFPIVFSIGPIAIGEINALNVDLYVLPQDLLNIARNNLSDDDLIALLILLQSLDSDKDLNNGIQIAQTDIDKLIQHDSTPRSIKEMGFVGVHKTLMDLNVSIVKPDSAVGHLQNEMLKKLTTCNIISDETIVTTVNKRGSVGVYFETMDQALLSSSNGSHGTSEIYSVANEFVHVYYTPALDFIGEDDFTYSVDGCQKKIHVTVEGPGSVVSNDYVVVAFMDENGTVNPWVSDGTVDGTYMSEDIGKSAFGGDRIDFRTKFYKVNDRYSYLAVGDDSTNINRLYTTTKNDTYWANKHDQDGSYRALHIETDFIINQSSILWESPQVVQTIGMQYLYYVGESPAAIGDEVNGAASGKLAWKATGRKKHSFSEYSPPLVLSPKDRFGFIQHVPVHYGIFYNTILIDDIVGDGYATDEVVSKFVSTNDSVYYIGYDGDETIYLFRDKFDKHETDVIGRIEIDSNSSFSFSSTSKDLQLAYLNGKIYVMVYRPANSFDPEMSAIYVADEDALYPKNTHGEIVVPGDANEYIRQIDLQGEIYENLNRRYNVSGFIPYENSLYFLANDSNDETGLYRINSSENIEKLVDTGSVFAQNVIGQHLFMWTSSYKLQVYDLKNHRYESTNLYQATANVDQMMVLNRILYITTTDGSLIEVTPSDLSIKVIEAKADNKLVHLSTNTLDDTTIIYTVTHNEENSPPKTAQLYNYNQLTQTKSMLQEKIYAP